MIRSTENRWLHRFAILTALATLFLICLGGLVTSKGVGMSVPDWPTTYGYSMFFFPFSKWVGGIFYEHSHRLVASMVGFLTVALAVWLWLQEPRRWLRWLGIVAVFGVVLQGVLGGLRVAWMKDELGIFHAALAQLFFVLVCAIALFTSRWWASASRLPIRERSGLRYMYQAVTAMIFLQLILGATMRHQHAGLAISDFPLAHGKIWPALDPDSIARYNQKRLETTALNPITAFQVGLQMAHRLAALLLVAGIIWQARLTIRHLGWSHPVTRLSIAWVGLILGQAVLGAATIWTNKAADIATAHVAVGALSLLAGAMLLLVARRCFETSPVEAVATAGARARNEPANRPAQLPA